MLAHLPDRSNAERRKPLLRKTLKKRLNRPSEIGPAGCWQFQPNPGLKPQNCWFCADSGNGGI
jgi:hypothetical protein